MKPILPPCPDGEDPFEWGFMLWSALTVEQKSDLIEAVEYEAQYGPEYKREEKQRQLNTLKRYQAREVEG